MRTYMNVKSFLLKSFLLSGLLFAASCARDPGDDYDEIQDKLLKAYIEMNYGNTLTQTESGIYIIELDEGTGRAVKDYNGVYYDYSSKYLNGVYSEYTYENLAKKLGTYSSSTYYGPGYNRINPIDSMSYNITYGERELLNLLREGGRVRAIVPPKLLITYEGEEYEVENTITIYEFEAREVVDDILKYQIDSLERFTARNYPGTDSLQYGLYYHKITTSAADTIEKSTSVNVNYIGRLLNGHVFDTSVADTARKYGLTASSSFYVKWGETGEAMAEDADNDKIDGILIGLKNFKYGEHGVIYFWSSLGYGADGSGSMKPYTPLLFEVWIDEET